MLEFGRRRRSPAAVRFLQASGERHQGVERGLELAATPLARLADEPLRQEFSFAAEAASEPETAAEAELRGCVAMRAEPLAPGLARVRLCVHNTTELREEDPERPRGAAREPALDPRRPAA